MKKLRAIFAGLVFFAAFAVTGFHLYELQIKENVIYLARAESQRAQAGFLEPERGTIYFTDKYGNRIPAAVNKEFPTIFSVPNEIRDASDAAHRVAALLRLPEAELKKKFLKENDAYELLVPKAGVDDVTAVKNANIPGIHIGVRKGRLYPFGELAAQVLGFVGPSDRDSDLKGRYGIEAQFEDELAGVPGSAEGDNASDATPGEDVALTIDRNIQARAEELLAGLAEQYDAAGGTVMVLEARSGRVRALGNYPSFDPNNYGVSPVKTFLNMAVQGVYEPGSVFKVITLSAGLDLGRITRETTFTDTGTYTVNRKTIANAEKKVYGTVTMDDVIAYSINTGAMFVERAIGHEAFYRYAERFGFHEPTGIPLPGEVKGNLWALQSNARDINFSTAAFGQGIAVTPLQLVRAIAAVANDGVLMEPLLLADKEPRPVRRVVGEQAADAMAAMLIRSVDKNVVAAIPQYAVAGKTGTAQIPDFTRGGYTDEFIHTYVGFAPAKDLGRERYVVLFKLDKPQKAPLAGATVVPAFRELLSFILNYYGVPPDNLAE